MDALERGWEILGEAVNGAMRGFERTVTSMFGTSNARQVRRLQSRVDSINSLESKYQAMGDAELREQTVRFRQRLQAGETLDALLVEAFAVCREAGRRFLSMRHYDVQLVGGMVLHQGAIAEMITGEGKTLVATLPAYLNALDGKGVHVVTVNDYLARRDMEWMAPIYMGLGLTVGTIQSDMPVHEKQRAYAADITYGTNNEFGFDYLRDNMRPAGQGDNRYPPDYQQSQRRLNFAIVDEVDNILIDEARTPLIISGPAHDNVEQYTEADKIARLLTKGEHFEVNEKDHHVNLTDEGIREAERMAGVESFYTAGNMQWPHLIDNALKARYLYKLDVNYVVKEGRVVIVDEFTGRLMEGRQWSDGLHQAVEAKEGVKIKKETQTLATVTLQNFFKLYQKVAGMTGTAMTEAGEFWKIYKLEVIAIPSNRKLQRIEHPDRIFCTEEEKYRAVANEIELMNRWDVVELRNGELVPGDVIKESEQSVLIRPRDTKEERTVTRKEIRSVQRRGRPILVGTTSIEKSELLSGILERRGVQHQVLNAKNHGREAAIVAQAGRLRAVTIATNMAGRGTDIILGGNPETLAWAQLQDKYATRLDVPRSEWDSLVAEIDAREKMKEEGVVVKALGGLHVIGTERHEARRIDLQLRGRCGRQGDPGSSRFYLSLRDDLMRIFAGPFVEKVLKSLGLPEGEPIESRMVSRRIEAAQKKVEEKNFEIRKNLLEYDEVMDEQRKRVYRYRQSILDGADCKEMILEMVDEQVEHFVGEFLRRDYGVQLFAAWVGSRVGAQLEPRDFRGMEFDSAAEHARDEAKRQSGLAIRDALEESLPLGEEESEWNWSAMAGLANARWNLNVRDGELKKVGRDAVEEMLTEKAEKSIDAIDLNDGRQYLDADFGVRTACAWAFHKFGLTIQPAELKASDANQVTSLIQARARELYESKESDFSVLAGICRFTARFSGGTYRIDRAQLAEWAKVRLDADLDFDDIKNKERDELQSVLVPFSRQQHERARKALQQIPELVGRLYDGHAPEQTVRLVTGGNGTLGSLTNWLEGQITRRVDEADWVDLNRPQLENWLRNAIEDRFHPEIRAIERRVLLDLVDMAWKDHLLTMDHLRHAVGLVGYAQVDPKVEYKREGMKMFEQMWESLGERVTDVIFRVEQLDESAVRQSVLQPTQAVHAAATSAIELADETTTNSGQAEAAVETIRNIGEKVGRNSLCPCGSGKKYKSCCMRTEA